jgi:hypothetical protein
MSSNARAETHAEPSTSTLFDLSPREHFTRVVRGGAATRASAVCAPRRASRRSTLAMTTRERPEHALGRDVRMQRRARGVKPRRRESVEATGVEATGEDVARFLSVRLRAMDINVLMDGWQNTLEDAEMALVMERHVFGARVEARSAREREHEEAQMTIPSTVDAHVTKNVTSSDVVQFVERALARARAFARAQRFPPAQPAGTPMDALAMRKTGKDKARRADEIARRIRWKIHDLKQKEVSVKIISDALAKTELNASSTVAKSTSSRALKRAGGFQKTMSAAKRARFSKHKPLVLKLREPEISILGSKQLTSFGRDVTNAASDQTRRVVVNVSKAASGVLRRNFMSSVKRHSTMPRTTADDFSVSKFPKLPR